MKCICIQCGNEHEIKNLEAECLGHDCADCSGCSEGAVKS
jgi:hypothetical protein